MQERQANLLAEIVRFYIQEAEPVGSKTLEHNFGLSSATIRHEMAELEELGYLYQPYTSAGRVPTVQGYRYYLDNFLKVKEPAESEKETLSNLVEKLGADVEVMGKSLAKKLAYYSTQAAVVGFSPYDVYYTGLSNLFSQPEFAHLDMVRSMGQVIDHLDEGMAKLYQTGSPEVQIRIGEANPLGDSCAILFITLSLGQGNSIIGLLGPLRMDYDSNLGRLKYVRQLFVK